MFTFKFDCFVDSICCLITNIMYRNKSIFQQYIKYYCTNLFNKIVVVQKLSNIINTTKNLKNVLKYYSENFEWKKRKKCIYLKLPPYIGYKPINLYTYIYIYIYIYICILIYIYLNCIILTSPQQKIKNFHWTVYKI